MIVIGFPGVGKSTSASKDINLIDLESSNFWMTIADHKIRDNCWYISYCNIAEDLSRQGYDVFVSSHQCVRDHLASASTDVIQICPALELKDAWLARLKDRYDSSHSEKDYKAYTSMLDMYDTCVADMLSSAIETVVLRNMRYDLLTIIHNKNKELVSGAYK